VTEACLELNPADAERLHVADLEKVRVVSRGGGAVEVAVRPTTRVPRGVVFLPGFSSAAPVTRLMEHDGAHVAAVRVEPLG
jgi:anaerobic selenocysteine-containing dehydrogenase